MITSTPSMPDTELDTDDSVPTLVDILRATPEDYRYQDQSILSAADEERVVACLRSQAMHLFAGRWIEAQLCVADLVETLLSEAQEMLEAVADGRRVRVTMLGLSPDLCTVLEDAGYRSLHDLAMASDGELQVVGQIGKRRVNAIRQAQRDWASNRHELARLARAKLQRATDVK